MLNLIHNFLSDGHPLLYTCPLLIRSARKIRLFTADPIRSYLMEPRCSWIDSLVTSRDNLAQVTYTRLKDTLKAMGAIGMHSQPGGELAQAVFDGKPFPTPPQALTWDPFNAGS